MTARRKAGPRVWFDIVRVAKSDYAARCFVNGSHVATVSGPERTTRAQAEEAAIEWSKTWMKQLGR